jgi:hypothetical protein
MCSLDRENLLEDMPIIDKGGGKIMLKWIKMDLKVMVL